MTSACPFGSEGVLEKEFNHRDLLNRAYIMKSPYKLWSPNECQVSFMVGDTHRCESNMFWGHWSFSFPPRVICLGVFWLAIICLLYGKIIIITTALTWVLWVILAKFSTWKVSGKLLICNLLEYRLPWNPELMAGVWYKSSLVGSYVINLWNLTSFQGVWVRIALQWKTKMGRWENFT